MTCYETLRAPAPADDAPMAHHFVKWWRNKFRNGYKKFSVGTESERTDTEELVGRAASQCSAPPDLLPSEARALLQPNTTTGGTITPPHCNIPTHQSTHHQKTSAPPSPHQHQDRQPRLRFEELTCDVELKHPEPSKQHPLQFSFTLYDLDGHGRMTKDDIAGIVSTIYESIGKSVTVPHYGSKTIQVRLTVVPEDVREHRDRRDTRRRRRKEHTSANHPANGDCVDGSDDERLSIEDDASSCSGERRVTPKSRFQQSSHVHSKNSRHPRREQRERKHVKKRSGSLQRRELLEIIQANMEKNRMSFQTSRKPYDRVGIEEDVNKYQKPRGRAFTISEKPANTFHKVKPENSINGYLDLAQSESVAGAPTESNLCRYDRYLHAVICSSAKHATTGYHQKNFFPAPKTPKVTKSHTRSRSHDLPGQPGLTEPRVLQIIFL